MPARAYDWENWFGRRKFTLRRGLDFACACGVMAQQVRNAAWQRGLKVQIEEGANLLRVVVRPPKPKEEPQCLP